MPPHDTQSLEAVTQDIRGPLYRPVPPRRHQRWQNARDFAWMCAGFAVTFLCGAAGWVLLEPLVVGK